MEKMMKQMGIQSEEIDAVEVIIKTRDRELVSSNPKVSKVKMGGNEVMQITGDFQERKAEKFSEDDVKIIAEQTGCTEEEARDALSETKDIAEAIIKLKKQERE